MLQRWMQRLMPLTLLLSLLAVVAPTATAAGPSPGDPTITIQVNDDYAGGLYPLTFERAYAGATPEGTPVYVYVPVGAIGQAAGVPGVDPAWDPNPSDGIAPCVDRDAADYIMTQAQINALGDELSSQIVAVDEAHYGEMGLADPSDPNSDALVVFAYNVLDSYTYDCAETTYTAGYFAPDFIDDYGMNVIVVDSLDWAHNVGEPDFAIEGIIAHELQHLLMDYSDPNEISWVNEGLADFAVFLNAYPPGALASHMAYHQVFHRETSLTRWGGGLENYGAAYTFFQYVWEQTGGNGDGTFNPDEEYDGSGGDLLIKLIFENEANGMDGVQAAIDQFNDMGHPGMGAPLRDAKTLFEDWVVAVYADNEASARFDVKAVDFGSAASLGYTIDIANEVVFDDRGRYKGAMPDAKWRNKKNVPGQTALPFGTSYEVFRNPGPTAQLTLDGDDTTGIQAHSGDLHWYAGYESQSDHILNVDDGANLGGQTLDFWTWYFIEEGWDYGFVEALVDGAWVTVPLVNEQGQTVTTNDNPQGNNAEGNGLTGTSGGTYFVDDPQYIHLNGTLPAGTTDVRFRYSTDPAYLDTGWFVDDVSIGGTLLDESSQLTSNEDEWTHIEGSQDNNWVAQIIAPCDLTPGATTAGEIVDPSGMYVYRMEGDSIVQGGFSTRCLHGSHNTITVAISNMPTGVMSFLDADYVFRLTNTGNGKK